MNTDTRMQIEIELDPPAQPTLNAFQLLDALRDHFVMPGKSRPGAVFLTEVTAPDRVHRADAIHVGLWASRGYTVDVCEIKASRADFQRELDKPDKAEAWWKHSNTFTIVAPDVKVAPPELLPKGWGLMVPNPRSRRFKTVIKPEHRGMQPTTALLAALLVSMETDRNKELERQRTRLTDQHRRAEQEIRRVAAVEGAPPEIRDRLRRLEQLEELIGFKLSSYEYAADEVSAGTLAAALRAVIVEKKAAGGLGWVLDALSREADQLKDAVAKARREIAGGGA